MQFSVFFNRCIQFHSIQLKWTNFIVPQQDLKVHTAEHTQAHISTKHTGNNAIYTYNMKKVYINRVHSKSSATTTAYLKVHII